MNAISRRRVLLSAVALPALSLSLLSPIAAHTTLRGAQLVPEDMESRFTTIRVCASMLDGDERN
jgi:hypothetical protein